MKWIKLLLTKQSLPTVIAAVLIIVAVTLIAANTEFVWKSTAGPTIVPEDEGTNFTQPEKNPVLPEESGFSKVAESDVLSLKMDAKTGHFIMEDKRNNEVYYSYPDPKYWSKEEISKTWKQHLSSPIMIQYVDFSEPILNPKELSFTPGVDSIKDLKTIDGGFQLTFELPEAGFTIPVEVTVDGDYVQTKIIREGIKEDKLGLIWVRLYPFFGATHTDGQEGYLFIPDGPGALINFKDNQLNVNKLYDESVYGSDMVYQGLDNNRSQVSMPVFGMKSGSKGFLAVLNDGEAYANIVASPSGVFSKYNWVTAQMNFRSSFLQYTRKNFADSGFVDFNRDELFGSDRVVRYYILDKENADYVGMAKRYRQYLIEEKGLKKLEADTAGVPLHLTVVGGDQEKGTLANRYIKGTTTSEAEQMVKKLHELGVGNMSVTYTGWQEGGYSAYGRTLPVDSSIGGDSGMKSFVDFAHSLNVPVYLDTEYALNNTGAGGFEKEFAGVTNLAGQTIDVRMLYNEDNVSAVSDKFNLKSVKSDLEGFKKLGIDGLVVGRTGQELFSDYNTKYGSSRDEAKDVQVDILKAIQSSLGGVQGIKSNFYSLPYVHHIQNMVSDYSYDLFSDEAVPFAQIATHGLITYSFNYSNNRDENGNGFLREIEYGAVPSFVFTHADTSDFLSAYGIRFYSTKFSDWASYAAEEYKRFNETLGDVQNQFIAEHRTLAHNVKETVYENGKRIIVNYNTEPYKYGNLEVPAKNFIVLDEEAVKQ
ncbi:hypothetical protein KP806_11170 [Paenibacillus sp. N4]|uniref:DUF5696 domain-containing protein n=1 Tax=Paenibacillus vietnamensis TaxID=2590547 RepID=UPI001CD094A4|nr:DUF5696 domain-containing protein [Paenibacillus vietnamensis]MCA0755615.1 hypothetical protein [Paenibacillus vietnamensis]